MSTNMDPCLFRMSEIRAIMDNPHGIALLMDHLSMQYTEWEACADWEEVKEHPWPTPRYQYLYERGRSIIAEDLEIWSPEILKRFGFVAK